MISSARATSSRSAADGVRERLATEGVEPLGGTPDEFARLIAAEIRKWADVVKAANIPPE